MIKKQVIAIALSLIILPTVALAKDRDHKEQVLAYNGPVELNSVTALLENTSMFAEDDVILEGYIVRQVRKDDYIFSDGEAEIQIELDDDIQLSESVDDKTRVRIYGEYEGGKTPEVEVEHILIL